LKSELVKDGDKTILETRRLKGKTILKNNFKWNNDPEGHSSQVKILTILISISYY
jgi:hypothetical protein